MVNKQRNSAQSVSNETNLTTNIRRSAISLAVAAALPGAMALPNLALAQDEPEEGDVIEEVVTYGAYTQSLLNSIESKRDSSSIIEAISAEDLGKLPDVSIAESLARLPGLTVQRLNGRGQVVNLRGMSPDFSTGILNGREQVSVGDNRGVEFDQYPSELLQRVLVYKTPDAQLIGQGLSGTVDMRTVRPLEYGQQALTINGRYEQSEYDLVDSRDNSGKRFSAIYIDQYSDETVGLVLGYSHTTTPSLGKNNNAWGYYVGDGAGNVAIGGGRVWARASELERNSVVLGIDVDPGDKFRATFDAFISSFKEDQIKHGLVMNLGGTMTPISTSGGLVTEGTYDDSNIATENNLFQRDADMQSFGANFEFELQNDWFLNFDLSHSSIDRSDTAEFESNGTLGGAGGVSTVVGFRTGESGTAFSVDRDFSNLNYGGSDPAMYATSPYGWGDPNALAPYVPAGQFGYNKVFDVTDDINAFRAQLDRSLDWGAINNVEFGYNLTNREKTRNADEGVITSGLVDSGGGLLTEVEIPSSIAGTADLGFGMFGNNTRMVAYNPYDLLGAGQIQQGDYLYDDIFAKGWEVNEEVHIVYVKFDLDWDLGNMPLTGNFGLQYQYWDQDSTGQNASGAGANVVFESFADESDGSEVLPSLNLALDLTDNQKLRLGLARTLARPRMDEMRASGFYSYDVALVDVTQADVDAAIAAGVPEITAYELLSPWSREGGNTQVKPWVADAADLSYEYYFENSASMISVAYFYKDLDTYVFDQTLLFDFSGLPPQGPPPQIYTGITTSPQNGEGGTIKGWEIAGTINFDMIARPLEGLGFQFTYSDTESEIEPNGPGSGSTLPGLSEVVWNATLFYERGGFSARVNSRYRDGFVGEVAGFGGARTGSDIEEETLLDAQISYQFQRGALDGLTLLAQGYNLTDEPFQSVDAFWGLPTEYQSFGATYSIGFSWSMR